MKDTTCPEWAKVGTIVKMFGVADKFVYQLYNQGWVAGRKATDAKTASAVFYVQDVRDYIRDHLKSPPKYKVDVDYGIPLHPAKAAAEESQKKGADDV